METSTTETVKVEMYFASDVLVAMQMIGLYGDRLEQEMKRVMAVDLFRRGLLSIGKAAELADMCLADFMDLLVVHTEHNRHHWYARQSTKRGPHL